MYNFVISEDFFWEIIKTEYNIVVDDIRNISKYDVGKEYSKRLKYDRGIFIYIPPDTEIEIPIAICFYLKKYKLNVHNIIIVDEGSSASFFSGCVSKPQRGFHKGITEIYVKNGAKANFLKIHWWKKEIKASHTTRIYLGKNSKFSNYLVTPIEIENLKEVTYVFQGENSKFSSNLLVIAKNSKEYYKTVSFLGKNASSEIISKNIIFNNSFVKNNSKIVARKDGKGFISCDALILSKDSKFTTIPKLVSKSDEAELYHEAYIGKISKEELEYLYSKGFEEEDARKVLILGFIEDFLEKYPENIKYFIEDLVGKYDLSGKI